MSVKAYTYLRVCVIDRLQKECMCKLKESVFLWAVGWVREPLRDAEDVCYQIGAKPGLFLFYFRPFFNTMTDLTLKA